jgi:hypothetical protein
MFRQPDRERCPTGRVGVRSVSSNVTKAEYSLTTHLLKGSISLAAALAVTDRPRKQPLPMPQPVNRRDKRCRFRAAKVLQRPVSPYVRHGWTTQLYLKRLCWLAFCVRRALSSFARRFFCASPWRKDLAVQPSTPGKLPLCVEPSRAISQALASG